MWRTAVPFATGTLERTRRLLPQRTWESGPSNTGVTPTLAGNRAWMKTPPAGKAAYAAPQFFSSATSRPNGAPCITSQLSLAASML